MFNMECYKFSDSWSWNSLGVAGKEDPCSFVFFWGGLPEKGGEGVNISWEMWSP